LNTVLFRVDAGKEIGLGHYKRCEAIANRLNSNTKSIFFTKTEGIIGLHKNSTTIKINDNYNINQQINFTNNIIERYDVDVFIADINNKTASENKEKYLYYLEQISEFKPLLVSFDDFKIHDTYSDLVVIPYVGADKINIDKRKKTKYLLGPKYFIIRDEFLNFRHRRIKSEVGNIFISMGGSDANNITENIICSISNIVENFHLNIIKGPLSKFDSNNIRRMLNKSKISFTIYDSPDNIAEIMGISDLGIISSGLSQYEASVMGLPAIVISLNDYHKHIVDEFAKMNSIVSFGTLNSRRLRQLRETIKFLMENQKMRKTMSKNGKKIVDGNGIERLLYKIGSKLNRK